MSNLNNWAFAKQMDSFKKNVLDQQTKRVDEAQAIMNDPKHQWRDEEQKKIAEEKLKNYQAWLKFYLEFYKEGMTLINQHENLVNNLSKHYDRWYNDVSNNGRQEKEMISEQSDILQEIFSEIWKELEPLGLNIPAPKALNLK